MIASIFSPVARFLAKYGVGDTFWAILFYIAIGLMALIGVAVCIELTWLRLFGNKRSREIERIAQIDNTYERIEALRQCNENRKSGHISLRELKEEREKVD